MGVVSITGAGDGTSFAELAADDYQRALLSPSPVPSAKGAQAQSFSDASREPPLAILAARDGDPVGDHGYAPVDLSTAVGVGAGLLVVGVILVTGVAVVPALLIWGAGVGAVVVGASVARHQAGRAFESAESERRAIEQAIVAKKAARVRRVARRCAISSARSVSRKSSYDHSSFSAR